MACLLEPSDAGIIALSCTFICLEALISCYQSSSSTLLIMRIMNLVEAQLELPLTFPPAAPSQSIRSITFYSALTAYFLIGKCICLFFCFSVTRLASFFDSRLLIARVCFGRRSSGRYFLFL